MNEWRKALSSDEVVFEGSCDGGSQRDRQNKHCAERARKAAR